MAFADNFRRRRRKTRVLMTTDTTSGSWTYTAQLVAELAKRDIHISLVSLGSLPSRSQIRELDHIPNLELFPTPFKPEWMKGSEADVEVSLRFIQDIALSVKPNILHSHLFCYANLDLNIPKLVSPQGDLVSWRSWGGLCSQSHAESEQFIEFYRSMVKQALRQADMVVCPSAFTAYNLRRFYSPEVQNIRVVYNGIAEQFVPLKAIRKRKLAVCLVRKWDHDDRVKNLLKTAESMPDMQFVMINPKPDWGLGGCSEEVPANVKLVKALPAKWLQKTLDEAALFISPTLYDPWPVEVLQAAVSHCTLLLADTPQFREIWEDGAVYFDPEQPASALQKLRSLEYKPDLICKYAVMARYRAHKFYNIQRSAEQYIGIYESLLTPSRRPANKPSSIPNSR
jgi:glycogen(starch) synthase